MIDVCRRQVMLAKVIQAITMSIDQVGMTALFGFSIQYIFLAMSFMLFTHPYTFPDNDTSGCHDLLECFVAHIDYGFRGAPVWTDPYLSGIMLLYDYLYYLFVILIL